MTPAESANGSSGPIIHDAEYYILDAQHGERWAAEDNDLDTRLAALKEKFRTPPNIIHVMWDDTPVGDVGIPALQKVRGYETPNMNRMAAEGINFMRMYSEPSCTPTRAACLTGRHPVRNGMHTAGVPFEYGGLPSAESTMGQVLSDAGYATAFYGKAHLGDIESGYLTERGFDEALWMPYNQLTSLYNPMAQMMGLTPGVLHPEMFPPDPYDIDTGWRPKGFVFALEGIKGGPVTEFGAAPDHNDYMKIEGECQKRTMAFIRNNAAAKKPFYCAYWPVGTSFLGFPNRVTSNGALLPEALARIDRFIGELMAELTRLEIAENTLVLIMADNGPMTHETNAGTGFNATLYRGGKGDYLEGAVRVPALAWWPGTINPGQAVGDIIHATDLFTTFARLGGATDNIPTDRVIDGVDQTALLLNGDTHSRRDYVYIYTGPILAATVKGRYKRVWVGDNPGLSGAMFYDLYNDTREEKGIMVPMFPAKGMFNMMKARHELWMERYPNTPEERHWPLTGITDARAETTNAGQPRVDLTKLPFDPMDFLGRLPDWEGVEFDREG
ncbi:sulfatase-like hydrolase/transferase [Mycobacterium sp. HNNTM2301]|uniref:sulfatase-like hydrolase/transferase n=1 Tax=Mycobacterium hainanense TaxID=3289775 RepID=UPI0035A5A0AF